MESDDLDWQSHQREMRANAAGAAQDSKAGRAPQLARHTDGKAQHSFSAPATVSNGRSHMNLVPPSVGLWPELESGQSVLRHLWSAVDAAVLRGESVSTHEVKAVCCRFVSLLQLTSPISCLLPSKRR